MTLPTLASNAIITEAALLHRLASDGAALRGDFAQDVIDAINSATTEIAGHCGRDFHTDTSATARSFDYDRIRWDRRRGRWIAEIDDCQCPAGVTSITYVKTDDDDSATFETTWTAGTDYFTLPLNGINSGISGWPITALVLTGTRSMRCSGVFPPLQVTAKWGWTATPGPVYQACMKLAQREVMQRQSPFGVAGMGEFGAIRIKEDPTMVKNLAPFCKVGGLALGGFA